MYIYSGVDLSDSKPSLLAARLRAISHLNNGDISASDDLISYIRVDAEDAAKRIEELEPKCDRLREKIRKLSETIVNQDEEIANLRNAIGSVELAKSAVLPLNEIIARAWRDGFRSARSESTEAIPDFLAIPAPELGQRSDEYAVASIKHYNIAEQPEGAAAGGTLKPIEDFVLPVRVDVQLYVGDKKVSLASLTGGP